MTSGNANLIGQLRHSYGTQAPPAHDNQATPVSGSSTVVRSISWRGLRTGMTVLGFAAPLVAYFWLIHHYGVNMIWRDQWSDIGLISHSYAHTLDMSTLWKQHNENRIFFPNLIVLLLAHTTHFNVVIEEYLSGLMLVGATGLLIVAHRRRSPGLPWIYYCPVAVLMLSFVQVTDTLWGFQMAWYLVMLMLASTLFLLDRHRLNWIVVTGAITAAVVGSFSSMQGLLIWPVGLVLLYFRRRPNALVITWTTCALATGILYFYHFNSRSGYATPQFVMHHPIETIGFFLAAIGFTHEVLGVVLLQVAIWVVVSSCLRRDETSGNAIGVAVVCYGLLFAASITYGRAWQRIPASRYDLFELLIPVGCYLALLRPSTEREGARPQRMTLQPPGQTALIDWPSGRTMATIRARTSARIGYDAHHVALAVLVCAMCAQLVLGTAGGITSARVLHQDQVATAHATVNIESSGNTFVDKEVYFPAPLIRQWAQIARTHHLSLFATTPSVTARVEHDHRSTE